MVYFDGQTYESEADVPDFGSIENTGATDCPVGSEQTVLTTYAKNATGDNNRPTEGDAINIISDGSGNNRSEQWQWVVIRDSVGNITSQSWKQMSGPPVVTKATSTTLGVVKVPEDSHVLLDSDGSIDVTKQSIGLGNVDNVRQYSPQNPAPDKIIFDGTTFSGDSKDGVTITSGTVHYDKPQSLTAVQQAQGRVNIGITQDLAAMEEQVGKNKDDIRDNKKEIERNEKRLTQAEKDIDDEETARKEADEDLQNQIDDLKNVGGPVGSVQSITDTSELTDFVIEETGENPKKGQQVSVLDVNKVYQYNGAKWIIWTDGTIKDASATVKGVVTIGDGVKVDSGKISVTPESIGLEEVANERQYSHENPVEINITLDGKEYKGNSETGITGTTDYVRYGAVQALTSEQKTQARGNIGALGVFASETERDTFKTQVETNTDAISDIKDEQIVQNEEIANLKKKTQWIGSIENTDDEEVTDEMLTNAIVAKLGSQPAEGYQLSVFGSDGNSTVYQYSETSKKWEVASKNADLQIASATKLGLVQIGDGLSVDENGVLTAEAVEDAQSDYLETDITSPSFIKNKPFGNRSIISAVYNNGKKTADDEVMKISNLKDNFYWYSGTYPSKVDLTDYAPSITVTFSDGTTTTNCAVLTRFDNGFLFQVVAKDGELYYFAIYNNWNADTTTTKNGFWFQQGQTDKADGRYITAVNSSITENVKISDDDLPEDLAKISDLFYAADSSDTADKDLTVYTISNIGAYGSVTGGRKRIYLYIPLDKLLPSGVVINVTNAVLNVRLPEGGYLRGASNYNATSEFKSAQGHLSVLFVRFDNDENPWHDSVNNFPITGEVTLSFTIKKTS